MTRLLILALLCIASSAVHALTPPTPLRLPRVTMHSAQGDPIELRQLTIQANISGSMAQTTVRMEFYNPNPRQLEGNLQFPLLDGQRIGAFALDIGGRMRPAVAVAKARGREVFDEITRARVDPALLEVTQGNNFKLRVYPIMPRSSRVVELSYMEPLARRGGQWLYRLPLEYGAVRNLDLTIRVNDAAAAPVFATSGPGLQFERADGVYQARLNRKDYSAGGALDVLTTASTEARVYKEDRLGATWFVAEMPVTNLPTPRAAPRVIGLLWDSSGSGERRNLAAELAALDHYLRALGSVQVRLTRLRDRPEAQQIFRVRRGDWSALRRALESTRYDGASALNDWKQQDDVDQYLLFSDGLSNYGSARAPQLSRRQSLFAVNSASAADTVRLAALAERQRGQLVEIDPATPQALANALLHTQARIEHIAATGATDIETGSAIIEAGMLRIAGRVLAPDAALDVTIANGGGNTTIRVPISADAPRHPMAASMWAAFRLRMLEADGGLQRAEIGRIGSRFGIPTRETSLIVLETLDDYVRFDIAPPADMLQAWRERQTEDTVDREAQRRAHLERVARGFAQRSAWWNIRFPRPASKPPAPVIRDGMTIVTVTGTVRRTMKNLETSTVPGLNAAAAPSPAQDRIDAKVRAVQARASVPSSDAPYLARLRQATAGEAYAVYLELKPDYADSGAFYLDAAGILFDKGRRELALRVLSNLAEMDLENRALLRLLGYRLMQAEAPALAVPVLREVLRLAGEEPQSYRDLGQALAATGHAQEAVDLLYDAIERPWHRRFPDIGTILLTEMNAIIATARKPLKLTRIDPRLLASEPLDLRVVLTWDTDNSDFDFWVTAPDGYISAYDSYGRSRQDGRMSNNFSGGYGPEEYAMRRAAPGKYRVHAMYIGSSQQVLEAPPTLQVKVTSAFGTRRQKDQSVTMRLTKRYQQELVGEFEVKP
ncbi:DUF2135 domain-containing protein [Massilia violaceinigra]|uniref:DUF2135 domain-containing protein n=1 Tax=Massilia violaceinigra TaxID=2045208 RepID=A0ABY4A517_9BURK|nr:VIT domain-containing protein [Massilia violaceinigra]UOD29467.1 DUF2135 domain-containing protein [Massilia violaceinigra]